MNGSFDPSRAPPKFKSQLMGAALLHDSNKFSQAIVEFNEGPLWTCVLACSCYLTKAL